MRNLPKFLLSIVAIDAAVSGQNDQHNGQLCLQETGNSNVLCFELSLLSLKPDDPKSLLVDWKNQSVPDIIRIDGVKAQFPLAQFSSTNAFGCESNGFSCGSIPKVDIADCFDPDKNTHCVGYRLMSYSSISKPNMTFIQDTYQNLRSFLQQRYDQALINAEKQQTVSMKDHAIKTVLLISIFIIIVATLKYKPSSALCFRSLRGKLTKPASHQFQAPLINS